MPAEEQPTISSWQQFPSREKTFLITLFKDLIPEDYFNNFNEQSLLNLYVVTKNLMDECNTAIVIHGENPN